jgi:hypothetical protein
MTTPSNALIAPNHCVGAAYQVSFKLDESWDILNYDSQLLGRRYDHIVILRPHWLPTMKEMDAFEDLIQRAKLRISTPGVQPRIV